MPFSLTYGHESELERLIGLAMNWCMPHRSAGPEYNLLITAREWPQRTPGDGSANSEAAQDSAREQRFREDLEERLRDAGGCDGVGGSPAPGSPEVLLLMTRVHDADRAMAAVVQWLADLGALPDTVARLSGPFTPTRVHSVNPPGPASGG